MTWDMNSQKTVPWRSPLLSSFCHKSGTILFDEISLVNARKRKNTYSPLSTPCIDAPSGVHGLSGNSHWRYPPQLMPMEILQECRVLANLPLHGKWRSPSTQLCSWRSGTFTRLPWPHVLESQGTVLGTGPNLYMNYHFLCKVYLGGHGLNRAVQIWWNWCWFHWFWSSSCPYLCA